MGSGAGPLGNLGGLLGLGNLNIAQGLNYKTDPLSCTVFVSNVSLDLLVLLFSILHCCQVLTCTCNGKACHPAIQLL